MKDTKQIIAERINRLAESETIAMAKKAREITALGHNVVKLNFGEPDFYTPEHIKEAAKKAIDDNFSFYTPVAGIPELRKAIAEKLKRDNQLDWKAENIIVSTGAKQTIANAIMTLINPDDEVIVFAPYWVTYKEIIKLAEGKMVLIEAGVENGFKVTPEQLKNAITPRTKAILYSSPSNPTGAVYTRKELEALAEVLIPHENIYIIADEIYEYISFLEEPYFSIGAIDGLKERTITVNGYSKGFAMTGWRVGYMAAAKWIVDACDKLQGQFTSATCSIAQKAALAATEGSLESVKEMTAIYKHRRSLMLEELKQIPHIKTYIPDGAFYIFPDVSAYFGKKFNDTVIKNSEDLCMYLIEEMHVALVSGAAFGMDNCIRISYAASDETLKEAVKRIKEGLAKLQ
ncbi:MAG: pyridoxal phosphate-dependent aminotransferase [Cytophagales bacterium]|nr:MAG: pyridoxal phosphate-dependent aminotransferase [Cytophagales bacterium]TAH30272.1 MAG: pyridoxal phosphate-dependent aminotransferase [Cytophagales bacterium]